MEYKLKANCTFNAASLDDALLKLSKHFASLQNNAAEGTPILFKRGGFKVESKIDGRGFCRRWRLKRL